MKNLDKQFQASRAEQRIAGSISSSQGTKAGISKPAAGSPASDQDDPLVVHSDPGTKHDSNHACPPLVLMQSRGFMLGCSDS